MHQLLAAHIEAETAFKRYLDSLPTPSSHHETEVGAEILERLDFVLFALMQIDSITRPHMERVSKLRTAGESTGVFAPLRVAVAWLQTFGVRPDLHLHNQVKLFFKVKFYTEALYANAFRIRDILSKGSPFKGLRGFESAGLRDVRCHLLTHPEGNASRVFSQSFQWGPDTSSIIKPRRIEGEAEKHIDKGLVHNMTEFYTNLTKAVDRAMSSSAGP